MVRRDAIVITYDDEETAKVVFTCCGRGEYQDIKDFRYCPYCGTAIRRRDVSCNKPPPFRRFHDPQFIPGVFWVLQRRYHGPFAQDNETWEDCIGWSDWNTDDHYFRKSVLNGLRKYIILYDEDREWYYRAVLVDRNTKKVLRTCPLQAPQAQKG